MWLARCIEGKREGSGGWGGLQVLREVSDFSFSFVEAKAKMTVRLDGRFV